MTLLESSVRVNFQKMRTAFSENLYREPFIIKTSMVGIIFILKKKQYQMTLQLSRQFE